MITFLCGVFFGVASVLIVLSLSSLSDYLNFRRGDKDKRMSAQLGRKSRIHG